MQHWDQAHTSVLLLLHILLLCARLVGVWEDLNALACRAHTDDGIELSGGDVAHRDGQLVCSNIESCVTNPLERGTVSVWCGRKEEGTSCPVPFL